jgi:DNA-directed RNA polymerase subunit RPC12/RpoP
VSAADLMNQSEARRRQGVSSLLPRCTHCGHRMIFGSVEPAPLDSGTASNDLEDITYYCVQCGTTLVRTK